MPSLPSDSPTSSQHGKHETLTGGLQSRAMTSTHSHTLTRANNVNNTTTPVTDNTHWSDLTVTKTKPELPTKTSRPTKLNTTRIQPALRRSPSLTASAPSSFITYAPLTCDAGGTCTIS